MIKPAKEISKFRGFSSCARLFCRQQWDGKISISMRDPTERDIKEMKAWVVKANKKKPFLKKQREMSLKQEKHDRDCQLGDNYKDCPACKETT